MPAILHPFNLCASSQCIVSFLTSAVTLGRARINENLKLDYSQYPQFLALFPASLQWPLLFALMHVSHDIFRTYLEAFTFVKSEWVKTELLSTGEFCKLNSPIWVRMFVLYIILSNTLRRFILNQWFRQYSLRSPNIVLLPQKTKRGGNNRMHR